MGRTPEPARLKLLHGRSEGTDSAGRPVNLGPAFEREAPNPPSWLPSEAKAEWKRVVPALDRLDLLKPEDRAMISGYCLAWSEIHAATKALQKHGSLTSMGARGPQAHPAVAIRRNALATLRSYAQQFGLSPASEQRLSAGEGASDDDNPFE